MKHTQTIPPPAEPTVVEVFTFDPWPFAADRVDTAEGVRFLTQDGRLDKLPTPPWLDRDYPHLVVLSDGTRAVTGDRGLQAKGVK